MKYLLLMHVNPATMAALSADELTEIQTGHEQFISTLQETGEMINTQALADPSNSAVVRVRDGVPVVTDGPYIEAKEFLGGFYMIEVENKERAYELAAMIPDARFDGFGVEVRPVMFSAGLEM